MAIDHIGIIQTEYGGMQITFVQIPENKDYKNLEYGHFLQCLFLGYDLYFLGYLPTCFLQKNYFKKSKFAGATSISPPFQYPPTPCLLIIIG